MQAFVRQNQLKQISGVTALIFYFMHFKYVLNTYFYNTYSACSFTAVFPASLRRRWEGFLPRGIT